MKGLRHMFDAFCLLMLAGLLFSCTKVTGPGNGNDPSESQAVYLTGDVSNPEYSELQAVDLGLRVKWANCNLGASDLRPILRHANQTGM